MNLGPYWWIPLVVLFGGFVIATPIFLGWVLYKRQQYAVYVRGDAKHPPKIKGLFFSEGAPEPIEKVCDVLPSGCEIQAPEGHHVGVYYFDSQTTKNTRYPSNPFGGLAILQVPIKTAWWGVDNPEPMYPHKHRLIGTAEQIFHSVDSSFMFALRSAKEELESQRKELLKMYKNRLEPNVVYILFGVVIIGVIAVGVIGYQASQNASEALKMLGGTH